MRNFGQVDKIPDKAPKIKTLHKSFARNRLNCLLRCFATETAEFLGAGCGIGAQYVLVISHFCPNTFWCPKLSESWPTPINRSEETIDGSFESILRILRWDWSILVCGLLCLNWKNHKPFPRLKLHLNSSVVQILRPKYICYGPHPLVYIHMGKKSQKIR